MKNRNFDTNTYARLLAKALPRPIETDDECLRTLAIINSMMNRQKSPEESALFQLLVGLVQTYEDRVFPTPEIPPDQMLRYLLGTSGMKQTELAALWGTSKSYTSEVVNGKKPISKAQAKRLAAHFKVSVELFL